MPEVANAGALRPPAIYLAAIGLGALIHAFWPMEFVPASIGVPLGGLLVATATALFVSAVRTFRQAGTPVPGHRPTTVIVRTGPYAFSRNPVYVAFTVFHLGLASWTDSLGMLLALVPALALVVLVVVPREERYLETRFPSEYGRYRREVRRWL